MLCCGLATLDLVHDVPAIPGPDRKVTATAVRLEPGGPATNAGRTARWLGSDTALLTLLGRSTVGRVICEALTTEGLILVDAAPPDMTWAPPVSAVTIDRRGRRTVVSVNARGAPQVRTVPVHTPRAPVLLIDGHHLALALAAAQRIRAAGGTVILDGGSWKDGMHELLPTVDIAVTSADFRVPTQHAAAFARVPIRARTDGPNPILVTGAAGDYEQEVPAVRARDTLGAGDVLHGALAHHLATAQRAEDLAGGFRAGLAFAAQVAAESCTRRGILG